MKSITIKTICDTAGALKLTQYGNKEAMKFAKNKEEDSLLVVNELRAIEFCTRKAIFVYPKGFVSYVEEVQQ